MTREEAIKKIEELDLLRDGLNNNFGCNNFERKENVLKGKV